MRLFLNISIARRFLILAIGLLQSRQSDLEGLFTIALLRYSISNSENTRMALVADNSL